MSHAICFVRNKHMKHSLMIYILNTNKNTGSIASYMAFHLNLPKTPLSIIPMPGVELVIHENLG